MPRLSYILLIIAAFLLSCEEQLTWQFEEAETDLLVVESVITNEYINQYVKLSQPYNTQNDQPKPISGANIIVQTETDSYQFLESPVGSGIYYSQPFIAVTGKAYRLIIEYNNIIYTAAATQPPVEPMEDIVLYATSDSTYAINLIESGSDPNYIKHWLNWQNSEDCSTPENCEAKLIFYDLKNIDINKTFSEDMEVVHFPLGTTIIRKKYSVSDGYKEYLRGMLSETNWRGGLFDVYRANASTNLSDGAVGYFAVSSVVSDTTVVQ